MKKLLLIFVCLISQLLFGQTATAPSSGDGTSGDPYQITSLENLYWIGENSSRWGYYYIQTADIDASETASWFSNGSGGYYGWTSIGNNPNYFTGSYNGNVHTIDGLYINRPGSDYQGLFGGAYEATISNLGVKNAVITGRHYAGGLVGYNYNNSTVTNCYFTGSVTGGYHVGGLVGDNYSSTVSKCYTTGSVTGTPMVGGLVGSSQYSSSVSNSYSRCSVSGGLYEIGGLVGGIFYSATVTNSYSTGSVVGPNFYLGGLVGRNYSCPPVSNGFWDVETSGLPTSDGGTGKTTAEMKTNSTFIDAGWDPGIWNMGDGINNGYPYLDWQNPGGTPLPVELTLFTASFLEDEVVLNWQTKTEVDNYGFDVERSVISEEWEKIGFVEGYGNSNSPKSYSFTDNPNGGSKFKYRLKQIDTDGAYEYSDIVEVEIIPYEFILYQNYPNPFNPSTNIKSQVSESGFVSLKVYDVLGKEVATVINEEKPSGSYEIEFDATNLPSGVYFYRLQAGSFIETKKMVLMK